MNDDQAKRLERFGARLGLPEAPAIRTALLAAMASGAMTVEVDCVPATEVDLSFVQLLLAARRAAESCGKSLTLSAPASGALLSALQRGGFLQASAGEAAFWMARSDAT